LSLLLCSLLFAFDRSNQIDNMTRARARRRHTIFSRRTWRWLIEAELLVEVLLVCRLATDRANRPAKAGEQRRTDSAGDEPVNAAQRDCAFQV
jgi:hypothetical protein